MSVLAVVGLCCLGYVAASVLTAVCCVWRMEDLRDGDIVVAGLVGVLWPLAWLSYVLYVAVYAVGAMAKAARRAAKGE